MFMVYWHGRKHSPHTKHTGSFEPHCIAMEAGTGITPILLIRQLSHGQISHSLKITQLGHGKAGIHAQAVWL